MKDFRTCNRGLLRRLRPRLWKVSVSVLIGFVAVAASLAFVWMSKHVVDIATGASDGSLDKAVVALASIMLLQVICRVGARYWEGLLVVNAQNSIREQVFAKVMRSTWTGKDALHSGDTISRLEEDIRVVVDFICVNLPACVITLVQLLAASAYLFFLAPRLAWVLLLIMPVAVVGSRMFFRKLRALTGEIRAGDAKVQGHMQENIQHRVLIKSVGAVAQVLEKLGLLQADVRANTIRRLNYNAVSRGFMQLGFAAGYALVFIWGAYGLRNGAVSYGMMVAFLQLVGQVQRPVAGLALQIPAFIRALSSEERLLELEEAEQETVAEDIVIPGAPGIRVEGLCFAYPGADDTVIDHLDFDFKPGLTTAILGPTGSGKSTLVRLVMALLKPSSGKVLLYPADGGEGVESGVATRCNFMYVPQGNSLMSGTIRQNLLLAKSDATEEEIRDVLHLAAADFVFECKDGLDTSCAEVGAGLSEGQAQRIAIARALLRPGGVLVLDEATSALDADTELEMLGRLAERYHGSKTILCITHRPAATSFADAVLRIQ